VLGAGIMGASVAIFLARRGFDVTLVDRAAAPLSCASRWNEGKIHLGYLYAGDPTLATAKRLIPGGLAFADVMRELIGYGLEQVTSSHDELYLIHRESVAAPLETGRYFDAVSALVREHPDAGRYLVDVTRAASQPLDRGELEAMANPAVIVAGYRVPERSVLTTVIADALVRALASEPRISLLTSTRVFAVAPEGAAQQAWRLRTDPVVRGAFDWVVNALWEGRLAVDSSVGLRPEHPWSNRYRLSLFIETSRPVPFPSVIVATGPFGDVKSYDGRNFYVSWYPAGLVAENHDLAPEAPSGLDTDRRTRLIAAVRTGITGILPAADEIFAAAMRVSVEGGWVFAHGQGTLDDPAASLHRRDRFGVRRLGSYISVDTGKYSTAPWSARRLAAEIAGEQVPAA
jgi:hypothetical protein